MQNSGQGILFDRERKGNKVTFSTITQPVQSYTYSEDDEAKLVQEVVLEDKGPPKSCSEMTFPATYFDGTKTYEVDMTATVKKGSHYIFSVKTDKIHKRI